MGSTSQHSVMLRLWVPVAVFAHVFAAVWLIRAFQLFQPALWSRLTAKARFRSKAASPQQPGASGVGSEPITELATSAPLARAPQASAIPSRQRPTTAFLGTSTGTASGSSVVARQGTLHASFGYSCSLRQTNSTGSNESSGSSSSSWTPPALTVVTGANKTQQGLPAALGSSHKFTPVKQLLQSVVGGQQLQLQLTWQAIGCSYKTATGNKAVLQDVWGQADAGELQALIGPSGAGKSHLLDILAHRKTTGNISGDIRLNWQPVHNSSYRRMVAYVPQDDNFIPVLSATECLAFYAAMLLPGSHQGQPSQQTDASLPCQQSRPAISSRQAVVANVLDVVGLSKHGTTMVGGRLPGGLLLRGLSSGERRRLSIAVGILADPSILFLDEPTSGLDSFAALSVMSHLQVLAHRSGKAVIAAIHQPRSAIWNLFDKVTLLASGLLVYHGSTAGLVPWLSGSLGYCYQPDLHGLVSDWALDLVVVDFNKSQAVQDRTMTSLSELQSAAAAFKQHYHAQQPWEPKQPDAATVIVKVEDGTADATDAAALSSVVVVAAGYTEGQQQHQEQGALPKGPFSRGGSMPDLKHSLHSSTCTSEVTTSDSSSSSCSSSSSSQRTEEGSNDVSSSGSTKTAVQVLRTLTATHGGMVHAGWSTVADSSSVVSQNWGLKQDTAATTAVDIIDNLSTGRSESARSTAPAATVLQVIATEASAAAVSISCPAGSTSSSTGKGTHTVHHSSSYPSSFWQQYQALACRDLLKVTRNPADVAGRTLTFTWVALLVGLIYYDLPVDATSIRQRLNLLFATLCFFLLMPFISMSMYTDDKGVYLADRAARLYRPLAYYLAKASTVLPFNILSSLCYSMIQYGMTGMRPGATSVLKHGTIGTLTSLIAVQVLHLAATLTPNQDAAFMMGIGWTCTNLVMSGFFIPYREIHFSALSNLRYLSALHYAFEGLLGVEFSNRKFPCPPGGLDKISADFFTQLLPGAASLVTPAMLQKLTNGTDATCVVDSDAVATYFGFSRSFGTTVGVLVAYLGVLHIVTFLALLLVARREAR